MSFLKENGVETIFTSAHIPETNVQGRKELEVIIERAFNLGLKIILDVSKPMFKEFIVPKGVYSLRLDWGFSLDDIVELSKQDYLLDLNASTITYDDLVYLQNRGVDFKKLRVSHNFFPKPFTALSYESVLRTNKMLKKFGLPVLIFISSSYGKRPPIGEGLPTIEEHRNAHILSILSDITFLEVDEVCFGDAYCHEDELKIVNAFNRDEIIIPIKVYKGISEVERDILSRPQVQRADANDYFIRSAIREQENIPPFNTITRLKKMVTIDNAKFLRYQGEVGIMKLDIQSDIRVNVVGEALISDYLLNNIKPRQKFRFRIVGEINEQGNNIG